MIKLLILLVALSSAASPPQVAKSTDKELELAIFPKGLPIRDGVMGGRVQSTFRVGATLAMSRDTDLLVAFEDVHEGREVNHYSIIHLVHIRRRTANGVEVQSDIDVTGLLGKASAYGSMLYQTEAQLIPLSPESRLPRGAHLRLSGRGWGRAVGQYASEAVVQVQPDGRIQLLVQVPGAFRYSREAPELGVLHRSQLCWLRSGTLDIVSRPLIDPQFPKQAVETAVLFQHANGAYDSGVSVPEKTLGACEPISAMKALR